MRGVTGRGRWHPFVVWGIGGLAVAFVIIH